MGVVGLGGLGHLAVKLAVALGADVTVFTTTPAKAADANALGAHRAVLSTDADAMAATAGSCDLVLDCVSAPHDLAPFLRVLALDGTLCSLGDLGGQRRDPPHAGAPRLLRAARHHGGVEVLPSAQVGTALKRLGRGDVRYRFVLDLSDLPRP